LVIRWVGVAEKVVRQRYMAAYKEAIGRRAPRSWMVTASHASRLPTTFSYCFLCIYVSTAAINVNRDGGVRWAFWGRSVIVRKAFFDDTGKVQQIGVQA
jgi:hypothetical protein